MKDKRMLASLLVANLVLSLVAIGGVVWIAQKPERTKVLVKQGPTGPRGLTGSRGTTGVRGLRGLQGRTPLVLPLPPFYTSSQWKSLASRVDAICNAGLVNGYDQVLGGSTLQRWYCPTE